MARVRVRKKANSVDAARFCRECVHGKPYVSVHNISVKGEPLCVWCGITDTAQLLTQPACKDFKEK